jgi:hypothetical protein
MPAVQTTSPFPSSSATSAFQIRTQIHHPGHLEAPPEQEFSEMEKQQSLMNLQLKMFKQPILPPEGRVGSLMLTFLSAFPKQPVILMNSTLAYCPVKSKATSDDGKR